MALFSRRPKKSDPDAVPSEEASAPPAPQEIADTSAENATAENAGPAQNDAPEQDVPHVNISVSTYGKSPRATQPPVTDAPATSAAEGAASQAPVAPGSAPSPLGSASGSPATVPARKLPPAEAPAQTENVPGMRDNVLLIQALDALSQPPKPAELMNVARQLLQGHVFLRIQGDAKAMLAEGKDLPLSVAKLNEKQYVLAFSGGAALQAAVRADGNSATSAVGQPVANVLRHAIGDDYAGLIVDHASSPKSAVLPKPLLERALEQASDNYTIKELLAASRTAETPGEVARALSTAPLWLAGKRTDDGKFGVAEYREADGNRSLEVFTHPLELLTMERGDQPLPVTAAQLAAALRGNENLTGVFVNPAGPWIRLSREELAPLFDIAAP